MCICIYTTCWWWLSHCVFNLHSFGLSRCRWARNIHSIRIRLKVQWNKVIESDVKSFQNVHLNPSLMDAIKKKDGKDGKRSSKDIMSECVAQWTGQTLNKNERRKTHTHTFRNLKSITLLSRSSQCNQLITWIPHCFNAVPHFSAVIHFLFFFLRFFLLTGWVVHSVFKYSNCLEIALLIC